MRASQDQYIDTLENVKSYSSLLQKTYKVLKPCQGEEEQQKLLSELQTKLPDLEKQWLLADQIQQGLKNEGEIRRRLSAAEYQEKISAQTLYNANANQ